MKKTKIFLEMCLVFAQLFSIAGYAAIEPQPVGGIYAQYVFGESADSDTSKNMSFKSLGTYTQYGLKLTPFTETVDMVKGGTTKAKSVQTSYIDFDVTTAPRGYNDYYVEVEYLNYPIGFFDISYTDKRGKTKRTELVCCTETGDKTKPISERVAEAKTITEANSSTKTHIFRLENADFTKAKDFTIETIRTAKRSIFEFSPQSVYIKSVNVYTEDKLSVKAQVKTDRTGNIFYDRDLPEFNITFSDNIDSDTVFSVDFNVYKYNNDMTPELLPEYSKSVLDNASVKKGENVVENFAVNVSEFGLYLLEVNITANGRTYTAASAEFSKCVGNDTKNESLGVNVHSGTWDKGTLKNYMCLIKNGGFGLVREGVTWGVYEDSNGNSELRSSDLGFYKICGGFGIDPYVLINVQNPRACKDKANSGLVDIGALDGVEKFVENLLNEPLMQNINHFEICNEPNIKVFYDEEEGKLKYTGTGKDEITAVYHAKGEAYGRICERVIKKIREKRGNSAQIGILSLCGIDSKFDTDGTRYIWNNRYCADNFVKGALDYLSDPNGDGDESDSLINQADVITYHPYSYFVNPEVINERDLTGVTDIAETYNLNTANAWHTEFGWSTATFPTNSACIGDDYAQAKNIIRQYASMYARNNADKLFIYDFMDDDIVTNAQESNYGLIHSELYNTPYAAKFSYLAVSNMNKMTEGLPKAELVYNTVDDLYTGDYKTETNGYGTKGEMVVKFGGESGREVYMLWGIEDNKEISYKIPENVVAYYDWLGNRIDAARVETNKGYRVSSEPFYAVCGTDRQASIIAENENNVKVTVEGKTNSVNDTVIVMLSEKDVSSSKNLDKSDILYADFCTSSDTGYYRFDCGTITAKQSVYAYIIEADGTETKTVLNTQRNNARLNLYKNMREITASDLSINNLDEISAVADLKNDVKENPSAEFLLAFYNKGKLTYFTHKNISGSYLSDSVSAPDNTEYDEARIYLWDGGLNIKPLCSNIYIK